MMKRSRLVAAAVTLVALATTGTASAATSGTDPKAGAAKSGAAVKVEGKPKPAKDADLAKVAAKLGVTTDRLNAALVAAKKSLAGSKNVTPQAFVAAVAANLGLPVSRVKAAVEPLFLKPGRTRADDGKRAGKPDKDGKQAGQDKKGADDPRNSPFASNAAAARLAAALGVSQAKAKAALVAVVSAPDGIAPTSKAFGDIAHSLGVSADRLTAALGDLKQSLANG
jgi:predicted small secreted protein